MPLFFCIVDGITILPTIFTRSSIVSPSKIFWLSFLMIKFRIKFSISDWAAFFLSEVDLVSKNLEFFLKRSRKYFLGALNTFLYDLSFLKKSLLFISCSPFVSFSSFLFKFMKSALILKKRSSITFLKIWGLCCL